MPTDRMTGNQSTNVHDSVVRVSQSVSCECQFNDTLTPATYSLIDYIPQRMIS